jgi:hypothetical protein
MSTSDSLVGAWSAWSFDLNAAAKAAFASIQFPLGVKYTHPQAVATQVVNGINYAFICEATTVTAQPVHYLALVHANMAPGAKNAELQGIEELGPKPSDLLGGWSSWSFPAAPDAVKALGEANPIGVSYRALASTQQLVAGINYCLLAEGTIATIGNPVIAALVYVYAPAGSGQPHVTHVQTIKPN